MGCDIHLYAEVQDSNGLWVAKRANTYQDGSDPEDEDAHFDLQQESGANRNYAIFGILCSGVRSEWGRLSFEPKGFPEDASSEVTTVFHQWGADAHTPSWLTGAELHNHRQVLEKAATQALLTEERDVPQLNQFFKRWLEQVNIADSSEERIVFWFDN